MRLLVIPCNGKRSDTKKFIEKHELYDHLVSADAVHALRYKMKLGAFIVLEGFEDRHGVDLDNLRRKYLYKVRFLDLESGSLHTSAPSLDDCKVFRKSKIGKGVNFKSWLDEKIFPLRKLTERYESVYHIGDVQGCHAPLAKFLSDHFNERSFYIFCGDYLDRGPENDKVFNLIYKNLMPRENVLCLWGNHESALIRWSNGRPPKISDFTEKTAPQLTAAGISRKDAYDFCRNLRDIFVYRHGDKRIVCSHGGLLDVPRRIITIESTLVRGERTREIKDLFDGGPVVMHHSFNRAARSTEWIQVHGHTNAERRQMCEVAGTVLLNDYPELGEYLRVWRLDRGGPCEGVPIKIRSILPKDFKYRPAA